MIESYAFGQIVIDGKRYTSDVIIYSDRIDSHWWRKEGHFLQAADLNGVIQAKPEVLIVGTGEGGLMKVAPETRERFANLGVELIVEPTGDAVRTYNRLARTRKVIAALHLTC